MTEKPNSSASLTVRLYDDALSPAVREVGGALAAAVKLALSPASFVIRSLNEAVSIAEEKVNERLRVWGTAAENIEPPPPEIAAPTLQALRFESQDPTLRELYLNLLARSMVRGSRDSVHPGFAEVLRQLAPTEARALEALAGMGRAVPLIEVRVVVPTGGWHTVLKHVNPLGQVLDPPDLVRTEAIDNFVRLGLLAVFEMHHITNDEQYQRLEQSGEARAAAEVFEERGQTVSFHRYMAEVTEFGTNFLLAVGSGAPRERVSPDAA